MQSVSVYRNIFIYARGGKQNRIQKDQILRSGLDAPQIGLEPTTLRLTAECSAIELLRNMESGGDLLSRTVTSQVPSALKSLTSVFGMGTGGTSSSLPPEMVSYLGNRFSFCPLGLPCQRFHCPFIGTVGPFHRPFLPLPGPSDALRILTTAQLQYSGKSDLLVFLLP